MALQVVSLCLSLDGEIDRHAEGGLGVARVAVVGAPFVALRVLALPSPAGWADAVPGLAVPFRVGGAVR